MEHRILDFAKVAFWAGQEAETEFTVPGDPLKFPLLDDAQVALRHRHEAEKDFARPSDPITLLCPLHPRRILGRQGGRK